MFEGGIGAYVKAMEKIAKKSRMEKIEKENGGELLNIIGKNVMDRVIKEDISKPGVFNLDEILIQLKEMSSDSRNETERLLESKERLTDLKELSTDKNVEDEKSVKSKE